MPSTEFRRAFPIALVCLMVAAGFGVFWMLPGHRSATTVSAEARPNTPDVPELLTGSTDTLVISSETARTMRLSARIVKHSTQPANLRLTGRLMLDPNRLVHVNTRFAGEVMKIGTDVERGNALRVGDRVHAGQLLSIVWSKEIGEKKSDLVDAISQMELHKSLYLNLYALKDRGVVAQRTIDEMQRNYESDLINVERLRRTLRSWRLDEAELVEIEREAMSFHDKVVKPLDPNEKVAPPTHVDVTWAEIDVKSPLDGVILEKNLTIGDIVSTDDDLFKVADLSRLVVMANIYEEDIPTLMAIPADERIWTVRLTTNPHSPPVTGHIEMIGNVIDPNQHTAIVQGWLDNSRGELRVGQFVEAVVTLPAPEKVLEVPPEAVIDDGPKKYVLITLKDDFSQIQRRDIVVERRSKKTVLIRGDEPNSVRSGDRVLVRGAVELAGVLEDLQSQTKPAE